MVGCDGVCGEWFHVQCIDSESSVCSKKWFCNKMVGCDGVCGEWFHVQCIDSESSVCSKKWFCKYCV